MRSFLSVKLSSLLLVFIAGCNGNDQKPDHAFEAVKIDSTKYKGLAFSGVSQKYDSSDGYFYNFSTGSIEKTTFSQSGDPLMWHSGEQLYFFNRKNLSGNFFIIDPDDPSKGPGSAKSFQNITDGGPQKILLLKNKHLLIVEMGASVSGGGRVVELNPETGETIGQGFQFNIPDSKPFQPVDLTEKVIQGSRYIFISHRGSHFETGSTQAILNHSQAVFAMKDTDQGLSLVANGLPVARPYATEPLFFHTDQDSPIIGGLCSMFDPQDCQQGFETISLSTIEQSETAILSEKVEISKNKILKNGSFANGFAANSVFASVNVRDPDHGQGAGNFLIQLHIDGQNSAWTYDTIHHYQGDQNYGLGMMISDPDAKILIFGENPEPDVFKLHINIENKNKSEVRLDRFPYNGVMMP